MMTALETLAGWSLLQPLAWTLLHSLWQGALVAAILGVVLLCTRRHTGVRYAAAVIALALMIALPVATFLQLAPNGTPPPAWSATAAAPAGSLPPQEPLAVRSASQPPGDAVFARSTPAPESPGAAAGADAGARLLLDEAVSSHGPWVVAVWIAGVAVLTLRLAGGFIVLQRLRSRGVSLPRADVREAFVRLAGRLGLRRVPALRLSTRVDVPLVLGLIRPLVLLPVSAASGLPTRDLELLMAHELSHVRRNDLLVNALQRVAEVLFFHHPAVWWVSGVMRAEREHACDELAVRVTGSSEREYVATLARLGDASLTHPFAAAATGGSLLARAERLLGRPGGGAGLAPLLAFAGLLLAGLLAFSGTARSNEVAPAPAFNTVWATLTNGVRFDAETGGITAIPGEAWILIEERSGGELVRRALATNPAVTGPEAHLITTAPFTQLPNTYVYSPESGADLRLHVEEGPRQAEAGREVLEWFDALLERLVAEQVRTHGDHYRDYSSGWSLRTLRPDRAETVVFGSFWGMDSFLVPDERFPLDDEAWVAIAAHAVAHGYFDATFVAGAAADRLRQLLPADDAVALGYLRLLPVLDDDDARMELLVAVRAAVREPSAPLQAALDRSVSAFTDPDARTRAHRFLDGRGLAEVPARMMPLRFEVGTRTTADQAQPPLLSVEIAVHNVDALSGSAWRLIGPDGGQLADGVLQISRHLRTVDLPPDAGSSAETYILEVDADSQTKRFELEVDAAKALVPPRGFGIVEESGRPVLLWEPVAGAAYYSVELEHGDEGWFIRTLEPRIDLAAAMPSITPGTAASVTASVRAHSALPVCREVCEVHSSSASAELEYVPGSME